jgi:hypothetical protein
MGLVSRRSSKRISGSDVIKLPKPLSRTDGRRVWVWASTFVSNSSTDNREKWESRALQDREQPSGSHCQSFLPDQTRQEKPLMKKGNKKEEAAC